MSETAVQLKNIPLMIIELLIQWETFLYVK